MHVVFVTGEFPPMQGGVGDYTACLARELAHQGARVTVVTSRLAHGGAAPEWALAAVVDHWSWMGARRAVEAIRTAAPDVVHIQYQAAAYGMRLPVHLLPAWIRRAAPAAVRLVTFHDLKAPYLFPKAGRARRWALGELMRGSDGVVLTNREDELEYPSFGVDRAPTVIPIGSNIAPSLPDEFDRAAWRQANGLRTDDLVLAYFGFLNASKGGRTLVRALASAATTLGNVRLLLIGGRAGASDPTNQRQANEVDRLVEELGVSDRVVRTGFILPEQVSEAFAASDMAVLPYSDGVSFRRGSLHAALVHGMPVLTTNPRVDLPEITHGENIWLVPPEDPDALAQGIRMLAGDPGLRDRLAVGALALSKRFAWDGIARRSLDLYERLRAERVEA